MVNGYPLLVATPLAGLVVDCASHVLISRFVRAWSSVQVIIAGIFLGFLAVTAMSLAALSSMGSSWPDAGALLALNLATYLGLAYGYVGYVGLNLTSLRIHILKVLLQSGGSLPKRELVSLYNDNEVVATRIAAMLRGGYLVERGGRLYTGKPAIVVIAWIWDCMRWVIMGRNAPPFPKPPKSG
jgi:hypothetical protein